jgi:hypothetical protein
LKLIHAIKIEMRREASAGFVFGDGGSADRIPLTVRALALVFILLVLPVISMGEDCTMPEKIKEVKTRHEARILQLPGVVSVGIGRDDDNNPAIIVGLQRAHPETASQLPDKLEGYPLIVRMVGRIKAQ